MSAPSPAVSTRQAVTQETPQTAGTARTVGASAGIVSSRHARASLPHDAPSATSSEPAQASQHPGITRWTGREAAELGRALRMTVEGFAEYLGVSRRAVEKWRMLGQRTVPRPDIQAALDTALDRASTEDRTRFHQALTDRPPERSQPSEIREPPGLPHRPVLDEEERVRLLFQHSLTRPSLSWREVADWHQLIGHHETRVDTPPAEVELGDLLCDAAEIARLLDRPQTAEASQHLTTLVARLAALISQRLADTNHRTASRRWAQIARTANTDPRPDLERVESVHTDTPSSRDAGSGPTSTR